MAARPHSPSAKINLLQEFLTNTSSAELKASRYSKWQRQFSVLAPENDGAISVLWGFFVATDLKMQEQAAHYVTVSV